MVRNTTLDERFPPGWPTAGVAVLAGAGAVAGSYGAAGFTRSFVAAPVDTFLSKAVPGFLITFAITTLGDLGQQLNLLLAITISVAVFAAIAGGVVAVSRRSGTRWAIAPGVAALSWLAATLVTLDPVGGLGAAAGAVAVVAAADVSRSAEAFLGYRSSPARRRVLAALGGAAGTGIVGYAIGTDRPSPTEAADYETDGTVYEDVTVPSMDVGAELDEAEEKSLDVAGLDPLVSEGFYEVDINSVNPKVDASNWSMRVTGAVERNLELDYADLTAMEQEHRFVTLRCVGEALNGKKMDNAVWTGVPVAPLLERAGVRSDCDCVMLRAADGYYEEFPLEALRPGMLAFGMNGKPLPPGHGAPVRALVPGHWGEVNVKWITEIELLNSEQKGYWEKKGWHGTGPVKTVAKIHAQNSLDDGRIQVGGHAYAGTRGIERVEVSTDGGETWADATLSPALDAEDAWRQWAFSYDPPAEPHEVVARAYDGTGRRQPEAHESPFPSGASGWVSVEIDPDAV